MSTKVVSSIVAANGLVQSGTVITSTADGQILLREGGALGFSALVAGTGIDLVYDNTANTLTITNTGGLGLQNTATVDLTYTPPAARTSKSNAGFAVVTANARHQMSIDADVVGLKLVNDVATPGSAKYYGTDVTGTRGYYDLPTSAVEAEWLFATNITMADPGSGKFRTNQVAFATSTQMTINVVSSTGVDRTNLLKTLRADDVISVQDKGNSANWMRYKVTGALTNNTSWFLIPIAMIEGGGTSPNNISPVVFTFTQSGGGSGGGTPGGSSGQLQYNNAGVFGGAAAVVYATSGSLLTVTAQAATDKSLVVKGAPSQSANLQEWQDSTGAALARVDSAGNFSRPGSISVVGTQQFGPGTTATASYSLAVGENATAIGANNTTAIGWGATAGNAVGPANSATAVGRYAQATGNNSTCLGAATQATTESCTALGNSSVASATNATAIGAFAQATANYSLAVGRGANAAHAGAIVIGVNSASTAANQLMIGSAIFPITSITTGGVDMVFVTAAADKKVVVRGITSQTAPLVQLQGQSSTTVREMADIDTQWADNTDASRRAKLVFRVWDTAVREGMTLEATGDGSKVVVRAGASQTANLQEWQDSTTTIVAGVDKSGNIFSGTNVAGSVTGIYVRRNSGCTTFCMDSRAAGYGAQILFNNDNLDTAYLALWSGTSGTAWYAGPRQFVLATPANVPIKVNTGGLDNNGMYIDTAGKVGLSAGTAPVARLDVRTVTAAIVGAVVRGAASQSANLQEWQDSTGAVLGKITGDGRLFWGTAPDVGAYCRTLIGTSSSQNYSTALFVYNTAVGVTATYCYGVSSQVTGVGNNTNVAGLFYATGGSSNFAIYAQAGDVVIGTQIGGGRLSVGLADTAHGSTGINVSHSGASVGTGTGLQVYKTGASATNIAAYFYAAGGTNNYAIVLGGGQVALASTYPIPGCKVYVSPDAAGDKVLVVRGAASQTGNLQEWQNSAGTVLSKVTAAGYFDTQTGGSGGYWFNGGTLGFYMTGANEISLYGAANLRPTGGSLGTPTAPWMNLYVTYAQFLVQSAGFPAIIARGAANQIATLVQLQGLSSTATVREMADIDAQWVTPTDATRKAKLVFRVWDTAVRETMFIEATGNGATMALKSGAAQTGNLQEWRDSTGVVKAWVDVAGNASFTSVAGAASGSAIMAAGLAQVRLSLVSGDPFTMAETSTNTVWANRCRGNCIGLYDGAAWQVRAFADISIALSGAYKLYDIFAYWNTGSGVMALEAVAWNQTALNITGITNVVTAVVTTSTPHGLGQDDRVGITGVGGSVGANSRVWSINPLTATTFALQGCDIPGVYTSGGLAYTVPNTRATALALQDGVYVKSGDPTRRYLGTAFLWDDSLVRDNSTGYRNLWNYYNRAQRALLKIETTASWSQSATGWRPANNNAANCLGFVQGLSEDMVVCDAYGDCTASSGDAGSAGIGINTPYANSAPIMVEVSIGGTITVRAPARATYRGRPGVGFNTFYWLEYRRLGSPTWWGTGGVLGNQAGMYAEVMC